MMLWQHARPKAPKPPEEQPKTTPVASSVLPRFLRPSKKQLALLLCVLILLPACLPEAKAGVFDALLRTLLPFYKNTKSEQPPTAEHTPQDTAIEDVPSEQRTLEIVSDLDLEVGLDAQDVSDIAFDDALFASDSEPMLDAPDLMALLYAEFGADRGQPKEALSIYKAESFKSDAVHVFERALALSLEYDTPLESLAFASAWQKKNPDHIPAWFYVAHLALKAGDYYQASQVIAMILEYDQHADLSEILTGIFPTNPKDQRSLFVALQSMQDDNPSLSVLRAGLLLRLGEYKAALAHVSLALNLDPTNLAYITLKIDILRASGQIDAMWAFIHQKRTEIPQEKELHLYEIRQRIEMGELEQAWTLLQTASHATKDPDVILLTALVGLDIGRYDDARELLLPLRQNPNFTSRANYYLGVSYEYAGQMDQAYLYYEKVSDYEQVLDARTKVVGYYLLHSDVEKAVATLVRLRDDYPMYAADSYLLQAEILLHQDKKTQAQNLLTVANRENPDDDRLLFASYRLLESELTPDDKRLALDKLLQIDRFNPAYQLADAKLRLAQNPNDADAQDVARRISQIGVSDPNYDADIQLESLVVLATIALGAGEYEMVLEYLQIPYDVAPSLNLGILLLQAHQGLGQYDKVSELLDELQDRFAFGQKTQEQETQGY